MNKKLTFYFLLYTSIILSCSVSVLAMKRKADEPVPIPPTIAPTQESLKEIIHQSCVLQSLKIKRLESEMLANFRESSGLTLPNWQFFEQQIPALQLYDNSVPLPKNFKQFITPGIASDVIKRLENNMRRNNICFEKINIYSSQQITFQERVDCPVGAFSIYMPFSQLQSGYHTLFNFQPNRIAINYDNYHKHQDFFNVCIVAAFTREISRIKYFFHLIYQFQMGEELANATRNYTIVNSNIFLQKAISVEKNIELFVKDYGFKIGILYLTLKNSGIAQLMEYYLKNNPSLCQVYGLFEDNVLLFFQQMKEIDDLKNVFRQRKDEEHFNKCMQEDDLQLDIFSDIFL